MKAHKNSKIAILTSLFFFVFTVAFAQHDAPKDWTLDGNKWDSYATGVDTSSLNGSTCAFLKSNKSKINGFGTLMQSFKAEKYHGTRLRLSAYVKTKDVADWAGLWMRIDDYNVYNISLSFDNMYNRPIKGSTKWTKYEVILDVPKNASKIVYGILLSGTGQVWIDNVKFEEVSKDIPTTDDDGMLDGPMNLSFEDK